MWDAACLKTGAEVCDLGSLIKQQPARWRFRFVGNAPFCYWTRTSRVTLRGPMAAMTQE